jgi:hypothetical protein
MKTGWWTLKIDADFELQDFDFEHIAKSIQEGSTSGEIFEDEEN